MMRRVNKNDGPKIDVAVTGTRIMFGDDELMLNAARYQRDYPVQVDICMNRDQQLVLGAGTGLYYVAQVEIPAKAYEDVEPVADPMEASEAPAPLPLNMDDVTCTLWSLDNLTPVSVE